MTTKKETSDIAQLKTDVALLKQFNTKVAEPALKEIKETLKSFSYVTESDLKEYKEEIDGRFKELRKKSWKENTLSAVFGSILTAIIAFFIRGQ